MADLLDTFRENLKNRLSEEARKSAEAMLNLQFRPVGQNAQGHMIPPSSVEEIALQHVQLQAAARAFSLVNLICDEEYRAVMGQPKQTEEPGAAEAREKLDKKIMKEGVYG
jgi:hypothetical protein